MSTAVAEASKQRGTMVELRSAQDLIARGREIERVVAEVLKPGVHYGVIPGTPKPSLYKPGADELAKVFSIAPTYIETEISNADEVAFRVRCIGTHAPSGMVLGDAIGECSSSEEKYKWRRPVCKEEFDEFAADRKRRKWKRGKQNSSYVEEQVRTEPADMRNTVLQMAQKRALVSMIRTATGVSAIFGQDLEDMPEEIREAMLESQRDRRPPSGQDRQQTQGQRAAPKAAAAAPEVVTQNQVKHLLIKLDEAGMGADVLCAKFGIGAVAELKFDRLNDALAFIKDPEREAIQAQAEGGAK